MKRISAVLLVALLCGSAQAADGDEFTRSQSYPDPFAERGRPAGPALLPGTVQLTPAEIDRLILPRAGAIQTFPSIDRFTGNEDDPLEFRRVKLFADGARIRVLHDGRSSEQLRPVRQYYLASNASTGIGLAVHPDTGAVTGYVTRGGDRLKIEGDFVSQLEFVPIEEAEEGSSACGNGDQDLSLGSPTVEASPLAMSVSAAESGNLITYQAVVAVDTDSEWLAGFGNDGDEAMEWITDLFLAMNVFYERDVETQLLIGDVTLRIGSDPYTVSGDTYAKLNEFGEVWMETMDGVDRQFATLFSGRNISSNSFSGIAWINQFCDYGRWVNNGTAVAGSYSYNAIGSNRTPGNTAHFVGHELGHNMGSPHTHCYSQPVDQCYSGETYNGSPCFSGTPACPADGSGTVMSYCHNLGGCQTLSEFHPTVQARLESRLASQLVAGCIIPYTETSPLPEFQSTPAPGTSLEFGDQPVGATSAPETIQVQNGGAADLTLLCSLSGSGQGAFAIESCLPLVGSLLSGGIEISCSPAAPSSYQATLTLLTNDLDEPTVQYTLRCDGIDPPPEEMIFQTSFEN
jgi:hypothetical protein